MSFALEYFVEAEECLNSIVPISLADAFFEETDEAKDIVKNNEKFYTKAINAVKNAITVLIRKVNELIDRMANFFKSQFMSADEKARFKKFKEKVKSNPELAKTRVTVEDFRQYEKVYDEALKKLEAEANKPFPSNEAAQAIVETLGKELERISATASDVGKRAAMSMTLSTAIDVAEANITCAKAINAGLKLELISLKEIEKELGSKEVAKFEKKIEKLSKKGFLHRWKIKVFHKKEATLEGILRKQVKKILSFTNIDSKGKTNGKPIIDGDSIMKGAIKNPKLVIDAAGGPKEAVKLAKMASDTAIEVNRAKKSAKKFKKRELDPAIKDIKSLFGK